MKCPNGYDCQIEFVAEENDNGDPSTPYFMSWTSYVYDETNSVHEPECPELTQEQIEKMEQEYTEDYGYSYLEDID